MESLGIIYGNVGTTEFRFAVSDQDVKRNEYIEVGHSECGSVLGQIAEITRETDLSFDKAQKLSIGEDIAIGEQVSALVSVIGYRDDRNTLLVPRTPFEAGTKVFKASEKIIRSVLGLKDNKDTGAYIGLLKGHDIRIYVDINSLVQKHAAILAKTGGGKSYILGVLIEELLKKGVPFVIVDPHGEYSTLMHPNNNPKDLALMDKFGLRPRGFADKIVEYSPDVSINKLAVPLKFDEVNLDAKDIMDLMDAKKSGTQLGILRRAVKGLTMDRRFYALSDVINMVKKDKNPSKWNIINSLEYLLSTGIFAEPPTKLADLVKEGQGTIINLKGISPDLQELVIARVARKLFQARKLNRIPPMMLIVEEAHNFCPQQGGAMTLGVLKTIASEGRKFGLGLTVVSQRPAKIDKNVLSQCATQIILKVTNPNDLKAITQSIEGLTHGMEDNIQRLPIGSAIVTGGSIGTPIIIDVRVRETKHGGASVSILSPAAKARRVTIDEVVEKMRDARPEQGDEGEDLDLREEIDEVDGEEEMMDHMKEDGTLEKLEDEVPPTDVMEGEEEDDEPPEEDVEEASEEVDIEEDGPVARSGAEEAADEAGEADGDGGGEGVDEEEESRVEEDDEGELPEDEDEDGDGSRSDDEEEGPPTEDDEEGFLPDEEDEGEDKGEE
jgi:DNA helicase HerA-like ATPase